MYLKKSGIPCFPLQFSWGPVRTLKSRNATDLAHCSAGVQGATDYTLPPIQQAEHTAFHTSKTNKLSVTSTKYAHLDKSNKQLGLLPRDLWSGLERGKQSHSYKIKQHRLQMDPRWPPSSSNTELQEHFYAQAKGIQLG